MTAFVATGGPKAPPALIPRLGRLLSNVDAITESPSKAYQTEASLLKKSLGEGKKRLESLQKARQSLNKMLKADKFTEILDQNPPSVPVPPTPNVEEFKEDYKIDD